MPSKKHKNYKNGASSTPTKKILTELTKKRNQGGLRLRNPTHLLYQQKIILTQLKKQKNHKHPKKQFIPPKKKPTHLIQWINQGLLQELIYLIKVSR